MLDRALCSLFRLHPGLACIEMDACIGGCKFGGLLERCNGLRISPLYQLDPPQQQQNSGGFWVQRCGLLLFLQRPLRIPGLQFNVSSFDASPHGSRKVRDGAAHYFGSRSNLSFSGEQMRQAEGVGFSIGVKVNSGWECACGPVWALFARVALSRPSLPNAPAGG